VRKIFVCLLLAGFVVAGCGGGGGGSNGLIESQSGKRYVPVNVNLVYPDDPNLIVRSGTGNYKVVFLINGIDIQKIEDVHSNLSAGSHTFTINVPTGGKRFLTVGVYKTENNTDYPIYWGDAVIDFSTSSQSSNVTIELRRTFLKKTNGNFYPEVKSHIIFGNGDTEVKEIPNFANSSFFAVPTFQTGSEFHNSTKIPIKGLVTYPIIFSQNQTISMANLYFEDEYETDGYSIEFPTFLKLTGVTLTNNTGISHWLLPYGASYEFSWNLVPTDTNNVFEVPSIGSSNLSPVLIEPFIFKVCQIDFQESTGNWSNIHDCVEYSPFSSSAVTYTLTPPSGWEKTGNLIFMYKTGDIGSTPVFIPFSFNLGMSINQALAPSLIDSLLEEVEKISFPGNNKLRESAMIIQTSNDSSLENSTISDQTISFTLPNDIYFAKVFYTTDSFITPADIPCQDYDVCITPPFASDIQLYRVLSVSQIYSPTGTINATSIQLRKPSNTSLIGDVQGIFLRNDGMIHHIYFNDGDQTVVLKDARINGTIRKEDGTIKLLFELEGEDSQFFHRCHLLISSTYLVTSDDAPEYLNSLSQVITSYLAGSTYLSFLELPPDRMFVEIHTSNSFTPEHIMVVCENETAHYEIARLFETVSNCTSLEPLFDYPHVTQFTKTEDIQFVDGNETIILSLSSPLNSDENGIFFAKAGNEYLKLNYYTSGDANTLYVTPPILRILEFAKENNSTTAEFYAYITNYKEGKYREGKLDFQPAEDSEVINTNSTQVTITWNPTNFDLCSTNLVEQVRDSGVTTTTVITNDGSDNVTLSSNATIYLFKTCPSLKKVIYKRFEVILQ